MELHERIAQERRVRNDLSPVCPHQIILVGSNPLPCYVAALALQPAQVTLVGSRKNGALIDALKNQLEKANIYCTPGKEIPDTANSQEIAKVIAEIPDLENAGLHYTAGKKTMSVHAHRAWLKKTGEKNLTQASYLDAENIKLIFDGIDIQIDLHREPEVAFDTLVDLHRIIPIKEEGAYKKKLRFPGLEERMMCSVKRLGYKNYDSLLRSRNRDVIKAVCHPIDKLTEVQEFFDAHYKRSHSASYTFLQFAQDYWGEDQPLQVEQLGKTKLEEKLTDAVQWLEGKWLEEYTWAQLNKISSCSGLKNVIYNINMMTPGERQFEIDAACMRGHILFAFSCSVEDSIKKLKLKLFEVQVRARQLGGDHARYALVCLSRPGDVQSLLDDVKENWEAGEYIDVLGWDDVMCGMDNRLKAWIDKV